MVRKKVEKNNQIEIIHSGNSLLLPEFLAKNRRLQPFFIRQYSFTKYSIIIFVQLNSTISVNKIMLNDELIVHWY